MESGRRRQRDGQDDSGRFFKFTGAPAEPGRGPAADPQDSVSLFQAYLNLCAVHQP